MKTDLLTPQNSTVIFIDHQPQMAFGVTSIERKSGADAATKFAAVAASRCAVHGRQPQQAWFADIPAADQRAFWGSLGCSCWMG